MSSLVEKEMEEGSSGVVCVWREDEIKKEKRVIVTGRGKHRVGSGEVGEGYKK